MLIDHDQMRKDVTIAVAFPISPELVIPVAGGEVNVCHQATDDLMETLVALCCVNAFGVFICPF